MAVAPAADVSTVRTHAGAVRVRDTGGDGPAIVLVHSLLLDGDLYASLVPLLVDQGRRVVVPDLPLGAHSPALGAGADLSPAGLARVVVDVLDGLGVAEADVVGVDTGGAITQLLMADHRDRVRRAVLTACDAYEQFPPRSFAAAATATRAPGVLTAIGSMMRLGLVRRSYLLRPLTHAGVGDDLLRQWSAPRRNRAVRRDLRAVLAGMKPAVTLAAAEANRDFPRPVLVAWGDDDRVFPRSLGERLAADIPGARMVTVADCAAFAAIDQPAVLAGLIDEHLGAATPVRP